MTWLRLKTEGIPDSSGSKANPLFRQQITSLEMTSLSLMVILHCIQNHILWDLIKSEKKWLTPFNSSLILHPL